ncbi:MAG: hypothetical protein ACQETE_05010 [Bacteroidota bacterium]
MNIRSIFNKDSIVDRNKRVDKTNQSGKTPSSGETTKSAQSPGVDDNLELSRQEFKGDIAYAKQVLDQLNNDNGAKLREVKQKIRDGGYDTAEVHNKISDAVSAKMTYLESAMQASQQPREQLPELDGDLIQKLTENDQVLSSITERLMDDLKQL